MNEKLNILNEFINSAKVKYHVFNHESKTILIASDLITQNQIVYKELINIATKLLSLGIKYEITDENSIRLNIKN